jgi:hypothetical protein
MSKQEKASWSLLVVNVVIGLWYFSALFELRTDFATQLETMARLFVKLTIVAIVLSILGEIVMSVLEGDSKDVVDADERDRLISLKARRNGYFVLVSAVVILMVALVVGIGVTLRIPPSTPATFFQLLGQAIVIANLLLLALMLAEVAIQGSRIFYYRRG